MSQAFFRLPLLTEPRSFDKHKARPCPICGESWIPWAGSLLPCHARCLFTDETKEEIRDDPRCDAELVKHYGVTTSIIRSARAVKHSTKGKSHAD